VSATLSRQGGALAAATLAVSALLGNGVYGQGAEPHDFSRYQLIIERKPFGAMPGQETAGPTGPSWKDRFVFVGVVSSEDNSQVLAIILSPQANRTYFRAEGETIEDVKIVRIDRSVPTPKLVLQQGLETATLAYQPTAVGGGGPAAPAIQQPGAPVPPGPRRVPFRRAS
jgi:hypothetical protein